MPNVTIKCKWCGKEFYSAERDYTHSMHMCLVHEHKCDKNPENKKEEPIVMCTSVYGTVYKVYFPTDEDKRLACEFAKDFSETPWLILNKVIDLFKRLGLVE
jgi:hypothetical protein